MSDNALVQIALGSEVRCAKCGGHLGDVFADGLLFPGTMAALTGKRFCIDGTSLYFEAADGSARVTEAARVSGAAAGAGQQQAGVRVGVRSIRSRRTSSCRVGSSLGRRCRAHSDLRTHKLAPGVRSPSVGSISCVRAESRRCRLFVIEGEFPMKVAPAAPYAATSPAHELPPAAP